MNPVLLAKGDGFKNRSTLLLSSKARPPTLDVGSIDLTRIVTPLGTFLLDLDCFE